MVLSRFTKRLGETSLRQPEPSDFYPVLGRIPWIPQHLYASFFPPGPEQLTLTSCGLAYQGLAYTLCEMTTYLHRMVVTSTCPEKTPSWIVMNLAWCLTLGSGQKVLMVDANCQWPTLHHAFDVEYQHCLGLAQVVDELVAMANDRSGEIDVKAAERLLTDNIIRGPGGNLYLLHNASATPDAFENTQHLMVLEQCIRLLSNDFDRIIIDCASLHCDWKPMRLASCADGLVLIRHKALRESAWQQLITQMRNNGTPVAGVIERGGEFFQLLHSPFNV